MTEKINLLMYNKIWYSWKRQVGQIFQVYYKLII